MKYLVNRETKEHEVYYGQNYDTGKCRVVEADADGWIKLHGGAESPLPDDCLCEIKEYPGDFRPAHQNAWDWTEYYRPILDSPDKEFLEACNNSAGAKFAEDWNADIDSVLERAIEEAAAEEARLPSLLERLKAAHEAAQRIPDIEAELRDVLGTMGYDLVARSPFVDVVATSGSPEVKIDWPPCNPGCDEEFNGIRGNGCACEAAKVSMLKQSKPAEDMSDWRNWRPGDLVECITTCEGQYTKGKLYEIRGVNNKIVDTKLDDKGSNTNGWHVRHFRFHSRPEVKS